MYLKDRPWARVTGAAAGDLEVERGLQRRTVGAVNLVDNGVPEWTDLQCDQVVELVPAVRRGGQTEPSTCWNLSDGMFEGCCGEVVAFVDERNRIAHGYLLSSRRSSQAPSSATFLLIDVVKSSIERLPRGTDLDLPRCL